MGDAARKELKVPHADFKNEIDSTQELISLEIFGQLLASGSQKRDVRYEVRTSTLMF
jgi:hypothetical protein